jgi:flagellar capping protein FliD
MLIDTRKAFRRLREEGGFSDAQADAIVDIFTDVDEQVATKGDVERLDSKIGSLEDRMDQRFEALEERMDQRFAEVDQRFESMDAQMDRRLESLEERMGQRIQKVRNSIVASVAAVGAVLAVVIPLSLHFLG